MGRAWKETGGGHKRSPGIDGAWAATTTATTLPPGPQYRRRVASTKVPWHGTHGYVELALHVDLPRRFALFRLGSSSLVCVMVHRAFTSTSSQSQRGRHAPCLTGAEASAIVLPKLGRLESVLHHNLACNTVKIFRPGRPRPWKLVLHIDEQAGPGFGSLFVFSFAFPWRLWCVYVL